MKSPQVIKESVSPLITEATAITITSSEDMIKATDMLSRINILLDTIEEEKEKVLKPLNEARKAESARWKPIEIPLEEAKSLLRTKVSTYQTEAIRAQSTASQAIINRVGEGRGKLKIETALNKIESLEKPQEEVSTLSGTIKFRTDKKLKIIDPLLIPREYLLPDEKLLITLLKEGKLIPGCEIELIQIPINSR